MDLCLGHADDLRSITISIALLEEQAAVYPGKWPSSKYEKIKSFCLTRYVKPLVSSPWLLEVLDLLFLYPLPALV